MLTRMKLIRHFLFIQCVVYEAFSWETTCYKCAGLFQDTNSSCYDPESRNVPTVQCSYTYCAITNGTIGSVAYFIRHCEKVTLADAALGCSEDGKTWSGQDTMTLPYLGLEPQDIPGIGDNATDVTIMKHNQCVCDVDKCNNATGYDFKSFYKETSYSTTFPIIGRASRVQFRALSWSFLLFLMFIGCNKI